jgi:hypothetical protein
MGSHMADPGGRPMKLMLGGMKGWLDEGFNLNQE